MWERGDGLRGKKSRDYCAVVLHTRKLLLRHFLANWAQFALITLTNVRILVYSSFTAAHDGIWDGKFRSWGKRNYGLSKRPDSRAYEGFENGPGEDYPRPFLHIGRMLYD